MSRGDVVLVRFPHPSGLRGKKRPAVVVQSDAYAGTVATLLVAEVTSNLAMAGDPACLLIVADSPEGRATELPRDSVVSCLLVVTICEDSVALVLGALPPALVQSLDGCLAMALGLPRPRTP